MKENETCYKDVRNLLGISTILKCAALISLYHCCQTSSSTLAVEGETVEFGGLVSWCGRGRGRWAGVGQWVGVG